MQSYECMTDRQRELYDNIQNASGFLSLEHRQIDDAGAQAIAEALKVNRTVTTLYLGSNQIGDAGLNAIAEALKVNTTVATLNLAANQIGNVGAQAIADTLKANTTLAGLHLGKNRIGDAGATAIAEALQASTALIHLYLVENQIGDAGAQAIAEALNGNTRLTGLYLYQNEFGDAGAQAMAQALKVNTTLTWLSLRANQIGDAGAQAVAEALRVNKKLTWLDLQYNCIGNVTVQVISETRKATRPKIDIDNQINPRVFSLFPRLASADDIQDVFRLLTCGPELDNQSASLPALTSEIVHFIMDEAHYWQGVKHAKRALFDGTLPDCILKVTLPQSINGCSIRVKAIQVLRNKKERRDSIDDGVFDLIVRDEDGAVRYECAANPNVVDSNIARATILPSSTPIIEHMREGWQVQVRSSKSAQDVLFESLYVGYV